MSHRYVGKPIPPQDGFLKVTGTATYTFDLELPGMLYAKLVTSTVPHARIKKIDVSRALQVPGVIRVVTGREYPYRVGMYAGDRDLLAIDKVNWVGHPIAAVIAETLEAAEKAIDLVDVEYEELPAVFDPLEALKPDAPLIHEKMEEYRHSPAFKPIPGTNIANKFTLVRGNVEKGFKESDVILDEEFHISHVSHCYMEVQNVIAHYHLDGTVEIWTSWQNVAPVRQIMALSLGIPHNKIIVRIPFVGGGFGGKAGLGWEALVAILSKAAGYRPVKLVLSRKEQFSTAAVREGFHAFAKAGFNKDGKFNAYSVRFILDAGAYADYTVNVGRAVGYSADGCYEIPNITVESLTVYTNKIPTTALRGFGYPESHWVLEQIMDRAAKKLGIDPVEIRRINLVKPGHSYTCTGERLREDAGDPQKVLETLIDQINWSKPSGNPSKPWKIRAKGLSLFVKGPAQPPNAAASAILKFNEDASIDLLIATGNFGQGTITALMQMVAEEFGLPLEKVRVDYVRDTHKSAYTWQTVGSRGLFTDGIAILRAIEDAKKQIFRVASEVLRCPEDQLELVDGEVRVKGKPWEKIPLQDIVMGYTYPNGNSIGGPIIGRGVFMSTHTTYLDPDTGQGNPTIFHTFGGTAVELELDLLTGEITILKAVQVLDLGKVINPLLVKQQTHGGLVMGASIALYEEIKFDERGWVINPNFTSYYLARIKDIPREVVGRYIETPQLDGPYGARGIGELTMIGVAPAIANAIYNAIGVKLNRLPMNPEYVWKMIREQRPDLVEEAWKKFSKYEKVVEVAL
ncbi:MAG: xanthine dehydrogenase family protein molybdopterin-binding subunit [Thaumarchaeota archaeon]|jgi:carbon-monoxide dehydrogenase large subunit|nr:xanthine dehydrogenase family protein molybdopterin-binding subunit [Candidatus Geocrenenecus arthurdayi]